MHISLVIVFISVVFCFITLAVTPNGSPSGKGSRYSKWMKKLPRSPVNIKTQFARAKAVMDPNARAKIVSKVTNGVKDRINGAAPIEEGVLRLSDANEWLRMQINEYNVNRHTYQKLEYKLITHYVKNPGHPHKFHVKLQQLFDAKAVFDPILRDQIKADIRDIGNIRLPENYPEDKKPCDDVTYKTDCTKRCIITYGYAMKPLPTTGYFKTAARYAGTNWGLRPTEGIIFPLMRARIYHDKWGGLKAAIHEAEYSPYVCCCDTRDDFDAVLKSYDIDRDRFKELKKLSSTRLMGFLAKELENTDVMLVDHDSFLLATIESILKSGRGSRGQTNGEESEGETLATGEDAVQWEQKRFHRLPTKQLGKPFTR